MKTRARFLLRLGWVFIWIGSVAGGPAELHAGEAPGPAFFSYDSIDVGAGLPSNTIQTVPCQTRDGYLWIATESGLGRYDGVRVTSFRTADTPGLPDNFIRSLAEDGEGVLWIATQAGLSRYRNGRFASVPEFDGWNVTALAADGPDRVFVGTEKHGLWQYEAGSFRQVSDDKLLGPKGDVRRLFRDSAGGVWAVLFDGGLLRVERGRLTRPAWATDAAMADVRAMAETPRGTHWFATTQGLFRVRDGEMRPWAQAQLRPFGNATNLFVDRENRLWVVARGLLCAKDVERENFVTVPVPPTEFCRSIMQDREGIYWLGTSGDGVVRMRSSAFRMVYPLGPSSRDNPRSVSVDRQGTLWAGMGPKGLYWAKTDGSTGLIPVGEEGEGDVWSIICTADGAVWFGTRGALGRVKDGVIQRFPAMKNVRSLYEDRRGTLWCSPSGRGLWRYAGGQFVAFDDRTGRTKRTASSFAEDAEGALYIGFTVGGVLRLKDDRVESFDESNGLPDADVRALWVDAEQNLWVGSKRKALAVRQRGQWFSSSVLRERLTDSVSAITEDGQGNLWLGTGRGLVWAARTDLLAVARGELPALKFHLAGTGEGGAVEPIGFRGQPTWGRTTVGEMFFVARSGLLAVRPDFLTSSRVEPPVVIERVAVNGGALAQGRLPATLPAGTRNLSIDYTALSFVQPERMAFRYQLVGYDPEWIEAGSRRTAFYTNLAPGHYHFRVIAANADGVWNLTGAVWGFTQAAWFYQTWWFYALAGLVLAGLAAGLYLWRTADLRRVVQKQTAQIHEQVAKEARLHAELERSSRLESLGVLAGGIAHDFNNLLTAILGNLGLLAMNDQVMAAEGGCVRQAEQASLRARDITQQLLTFARGGEPVRTAVVLADVVRESADFARHGSSVRIEFDLAPDLPPADVDAGQIGRVMHNLVLNAVQMMPTGGVLRVTLVREEIGEKGPGPELPAGVYLKLTVTDTGPGIAPEHLPRVFEPYFSTKTGNSGLGLATVHSIVKKHRGHVEVDSVLGRGTTFRLWLPAAKIPATAPAAAAAPEIPKAGVRVLFMDDEQIICDFVGRVAARQGWDMVTAADGAIAVREYTQAQVAGRRFDVVILDLTVPGGMGGKETMEELRRIDPTVCAIASSGYSSDPVMANFQAYGFRAVVPKPYEIQTLVRTINAVT